MEGTHRPIAPADLHTIYTMYMDAATNPFMFYEQMPLTDFELIYDEMLRDTNRFVYETPQGIAAVYLLRSYGYRASHNAYFGGFAVHPSFRRQGIAQRVLNDIFEHLATRSIRRLELLVEVDNPAAIALYQKLGFVEEGRLRGFTKRRDEAEFVDDLLLAKYLEN